MYASFKALICAYAVVINKQQTETVFDACRPSPTLAKESSFVGEIFYLEGFTVYVWLNAHVVWQTGRSEPINRGLTVISFRKGRVQNYIMKLTVTTNSTSLLLLLLGHNEEPLFQIYGDRWQLCNKI